MAKTVAVFTGDFTHAEVSNEDGATDEITIGEGDKTMVEEWNYVLIADNSKDSNKIEVRSETVDVRAMAVKDGVAVMGGGRYVMVEASRNSATGTVSGDNAKMAIQTDDAVASFHSNCPNARCTVTVTEKKSQAGSGVSKCKLSSLKLCDSDAKEDLQNYEQTAQRTSEMKDNNISSKDEKSNEKPPKDQHKASNFCLLTCVCI